MPWLSENQRRNLSSGENNTGHWCPGPSLLGLISAHCTGLFAVDFLGGEPHPEKTTEVPSPTSGKAQLVRCPMDVGAAAAGDPYPPDTALTLHVDKCTSASVIHMSHCGVLLTTGLVCSALTIKPLLLARISIC